MIPRTPAVALALSLCAMLPSPLALAEIPDTIPEPGAPRDVPVPTPSEQTLANGLRVIVVQRSGLPLVTAELLVRSGGEVDPPQLAGLADFTATLATKGTKTRSAPAIANTAESLGGSLDSNAGWDWSNVSITVTKPKLAAALDLLADVIMRPVFANEELERLRRQTIDSLRVAFSQPGTLAQMTAARAAIGDGAYGHPRGGTPNSVTGIQRADVVKLHATYYRPDNALLVFAGDIDSKTALRFANASFGRWSRPNTALPASPRTMGTAIAQPVLVVDMPEAGQAGVAAALPNIARRAPDYYQGLVANSILGGGYSSRLNQEIRIKRGLSYGANSQYDARRSGGLMLALTQTKNPSAAEVADLLAAEFAKLVASAPDDSEFSVRKANLVGGFGRNLETTAGLAAQVSGLAVRDVELAEIGRFIANINKVKAQEVQQFAQAHWQPANIRTVVVGNAREFADALRKNHPNAQMIPVSELDLDRAEMKK